MISTLGKTQRTCPRHYSYDFGCNCCVQTSGGGSRGYVNPPALLGKTQRTCPRGYTWNAAGNFCEQTSGGGSARIRAIKHLQLLGTTDTELMTQYMSDLADSERSVLYYQNEVSMYPDSQEAKNRLAYWTARVAALKLLISKGVTYIRKKGSASYNSGGNLIENTMAPFLNTLSKGLNNVNNSNVFAAPGDMIDSLIETVQSDSLIAGFPNWAIIGLVSAGAYMLFSNSNDKK